MLIGTGLAMKQRIYNLTVYGLIGVLAAGNLYQCRAEIRVYLLEMLGNPEDASIDPNSAEAMRSAIQGMEARVEKLHQDYSSKRESDMKEVRANSENFAIYRQLAEQQQSQFDVMQEKVDEAAKKGDSAKSELRTVIKDLIKSKALPDFYHTF